MTICPTPPVSTTVYSVVWPETEALVRRCMTHELDAMLNAHRDAHTKHQDGLHEPFFDAWTRFAAPALAWNPGDFPEHYPTAGSSEAIRELIRRQAWTGQDLVVFDGEYEGYEAIAAAQGTRVHRVDRTDWRGTLDAWRRTGAPWGEKGAVWWVSQPSALDGNLWSDFADWLDAVEALAGVSGGCRVWVDLTYVGRARMATPIALTSPVVDGVVFSLSKVMGAYYRRIGGCMARAEVPGLWANRWFKNLDALYLGQRWLEEAGDALTEGAKYREAQQTAMALALEALGGDAEWRGRGVVWKASDVALLMYAEDPNGLRGADEPFCELWFQASRGQARNGPEHRWAAASRRYCLTPTLCGVVGAPAHTFDSEEEPAHVAP